MAIRSQITSHAATDELNAHRHEGAYVALVLEGGYNELSSDGAWCFEPGDVVVHPPHHLHANGFKERTQVLNLRIPEKFAGLEEFQTYTVKRPSSPDALLKDVQDIEELRHLLADTNPVHRQEPDSWIDSMASELEADSSLRIADLARRFRVTGEHASRRFRQRYAMTASTYRSERRFRHALDLLRLTTHTLSEISQMSGYSDQPHFCRSCLAITGLSPVKLRNRYS